MTTLYIVRHGETENNINDILQGYTVDSPLTQKGIGQAENLAEELSPVHFDEVYSSDLPRAKKTAEIIAAGRKLEIKTTKTLREQNYGKYEGVGYDEFYSALKERFQLFDKLSDEEKKHFLFAEGMETDRETVERFLTFIKELSAENPEKTVLIVTHGDVIKYFLIHIGFATYSQLNGETIENCSYIKLESNGTDFLVKEAKGIHKSTS